MDNKTRTDSEGTEPRAPYEAPAIEQSASFDRLQLACSRTPAMAEQGECDIFNVNS